MFHFWWFFGKYWHVIVMGFVAIVLIYAMLRSILDYGKKRNARPF